MKKVIRKIKNGINGFLINYKIIPKIEKTSVYTRVRWLDKEWYFWK